MRSFLIIIALLSLEVFAQNTVEHRNPLASIDNHLEELKQLREKANFADLKIFLDKHGLDMMSQVAPEDAAQVVSEITGAVRRSNNRDPECAKNPETKEWWHSFSLKLGQIYIGRFYGGPLLIGMNEGAHAFVPTDYRNYPAFALMQASASDENINIWAHDEIRNIGNYLQQRNAEVRKGELSAELLPNEFLRHYELPIKALLIRGSPKDKAVIERLFCIPGFRLALVSQLGMVKDFDSQRMTERLVKADFTEGERPFVMKALARAASLEENRYSLDNKFVELLEAFVKREPMHDGDTPEYLLPPDCSKIRTAR